MLAGRLAVEAVEVRMPVWLRGVYPVPHGQTLERLRHCRCGGEGLMGVLLRAHWPGEGTGSRVWWMPPRVGHWGHTWAVAVIHCAHENLASSVLGQLRGAAVWIMRVRKHRTRVVHGLRTGRSTAVSHRVASPQSMLGGLALTGGGTWSWSETQAGLLSSRTGRRRGRLHKTRSSLTAAPSVRESHWVPALLCTQIGWNSLEEVCRSAKRS